MLQNLISGVKLMFAPDGASGSADNGTPAPDNAENTLQGAFDSAAGTEVNKPVFNPEGDKNAGGSGTESDVKLAAWADQLPAEIRLNPELVGRLAKFGKVGDMAKAFLELQAKSELSGEGIAIPGKNATADEAAAFWEKAGRPKAADGYTFAKDKENNGAEFAEVAFKANLTAAQADAMFKTLNELGAAQLVAAQKAQAIQVKEASAALAAEYGSKYNEKIELLRRGLAAAGPNVGKLLSQAGLTGNPEIIKAFISFGEMTAESRAARGSGVLGKSGTAQSGGRIRICQKQGA